MEAKAEDQEINEKKDQKVIDQVDDTVKGSPPEEEAPKKKGMPRRVKRLLEKNEALSNEKTEVATKLDAVLAENELMKKVLFKEKGEPETFDRPPTLEDFDYDSEKFSEANAKYIESLVSKKVETQVQTQAQTAEMRAREISLQQARAAHYERADQLNVDDYDQSEEAAIQILGEPLAKGIIESLENSQDVIYFLGKNPEKALEIRRLNEKDPVKATLELGRLSAKQTASLGGGSSIEPETKVSGGNSGASLSEATYRKKLEEARQKATNGDLSEVAAIRREMRAAGYIP